MRDRSSPRRCKASRCAAATRSLVLACRHRGHCGSTGRRAHRRASQFEPCTLAAPSLPITVAARCATVESRWIDAHRADRRIELAVARWRARRRARAGPGVHARGRAGAAALRSFPAGLERVSRGAARAGDVDARRPTRHGSVASAHCHERAGGRAGGATAPGRLATSGRGLSRAARYRSDASSRRARRRRSRRRTLGARRSAGQPGRRVVWDTRGARIRYAGIRSARAPLCSTASCRPRSRWARSTGATSRRRSDASLAALYTRCRLSPAVRGSAPDARRHCSSGCATRRRWSRIAIR